MFKVSINDKILEFDDFKSFNEIVQFIKERNKEFRSYFDIAKRTHVFVKNI